MTLRERKSESETNSNGLRMENRESADSKTATTLNRYTTELFPHELLA